MAENFSLLAPRRYVGRNNLEPIQNFFLLFKQTLTCALSYRLPFSLSRLMFL